MNDHADYSDVEISRAIITRYFNKLDDHLELDVAIGGAGPAGLCASYYLAKAGYKVAIFERRLSLGGGMWGGGMMFNELVVGPGGKRILDEFSIPNAEWKEGYFTADSVHCVVQIAARAMSAGAKIFNLISVEDLMVNDEGVAGLVLNWSAVEMGGLHVDPLSIGAKYVIEATGHPLEIITTLVRKNDVKLNTSTGGILGETSMFAQRGEKMVVENTREIFPHLYVAGMAANAVFGSNRMGPIFGGMLESGKKVAEDIIKKLEKE